MNQFLEWISKLFGSWKFWVVIPPWDIGVRVRFGKNATELKPGIHFRLPFFDDITLVNTRLRTAGTPPVTIQSGINKVKTISAVYGFRIIDPVLAMNSFEWPSSAISAILVSEISEKRTALECEKIVSDYFKTKGILVDFVRFNEDVESKVYRLIQAQSHISSTDRYKDSSEYAGKY